MTPQEQLRTESERAGFVRTVWMWTMDSGILLHHTESTLYLRTVQILKQNFGYTSTQRLVLFLMSKFSVNTAFMESRFRSPQQLETKPMSGWSYPEAEIVTWMSYDTENQRIFLKKFFKNLCKNKRKSIPKVKSQKTTFLFIKDFVRTCQPMNTVTDTAGNNKSQKLSANWYDMSIRENETLMGQFIGKSDVESS